jgi:hypothetical protein
MLRLLCDERCDCLELDFNRSFSEGIGWSWAWSARPAGDVFAAGAISGAGLGEWTNKAQLNTNAPNDTAEIHTCMMVLLIFCIRYLLRRKFTTTKDTKGHKLIIPSDA